MIEDKKYQSPELTELQVAAVAVKVDAFVADEKITQKTTRALHACIDALMSNLPSGVERVDGAIVEPLLEKSISAYRLSLPVEPIEGI